MKVGDLVSHLYEKGIGVILKTPAWTNSHDYLVLFSNRDSAAWYRKEYLTVVKTS